MELVVIFGPSAVGKMTVGHALCQVTGYKVLHNHMTIDPILEIFEFGSPPFGRLVGELRRRMIEEAADSDLPGLVFAFVWALEDLHDRAAVEGYCEIVESRGGRVRFVELYAEQRVRLERNTTPFRLERKRTKRDLEFSRQNLLDADDRHRLNSSPEGPPVEAAAVWSGRDYLRLDNSDLAPEEVARRVAQTFGLRTSEDRA